MIPLLLLLCFQEPEIVIPSVGRPDRDFYNAAGEKVIVTQKLEPSKLKVGEWATYTLDIRGLLNAKDVERPKLDSLLFFKSHFQIEDLPDPKELAKDQRIFLYRLRPRDADPREIPPFAFRYYDPRVQDAEAAYRLTTGGAILVDIETPDAPQIEVRVLPKELHDALQVTFFIHKDDYIPTLLICVLVPTFTYLLAAHLWRRNHPTESERSVWLSSRAANSARERMTRTPENERTLRASEILLDYLRTRFGLPDGARTLSEVEPFLRSSGGSEAALDFLRDADRIKYGDPDKPVDWLPRLEQVLLGLEQGKDRKNQSVARIGVACLSVLMLAGTFLEANIDRLESLIRKRNDPMAIAECYRILASEPGHSGARRALHFLQDKIQYPESIAILKQHSFDRFDLISDIVKFAVVFLLWSIGCWFLFREITKAKRGWMASVCILAAGGWSIFFCTRHSNILGEFLHPEREVVLRSSHMLHAGNGPHYDPVLPAALPAGHILKKAGERGGWLRVEYAPDKFGWVDEKAVIRVADLTPPR